MKASEVQVPYKRISSGLIPVLHFACTRPKSSVKYLPQKHVQLVAVECEFALQMIQTFEEIWHLTDIIERVCDFVQLRSAIW